MSDLHLSLDTAALTHPLSQWRAATAESVVNDLEQGKVIYLPQLAFTLTEQEKTLLDPAVVDPKRKNISYQPLKDKLNGVAVASQAPEV